MPSYDASMLILCVILIAGMLVMIWRYTTIIAQLSARGSRYDERIENQRIRMMEICIEKMQVDQGSNDAVKMAHLHGSEHRENVLNQLKRDAESENPPINRAVERTMERRQEHVPDPQFSEKDAFS